MSETASREPGVLKRLFGLNWITIFGASLTTASFLTIAGLIIISAAGGVESPYVGIIAFLIMPGVFIAGLLLIPVGALWERRRLRRAGAPEDAAMVIDLRRRNTQRAVALLTFLTIANLFIISSLTYGGVHYMDSTEFCGTVCHSVMEPEHTAYLNSPHSRVKCVECHIGPGAPWFVKAKLSGVRQVFAVLFDTYHRPIQTPVENLRPSRDICEQCHWPDKFTGDRMRVKSQFSDDETNTRLITAMLLHIGGGSSAQHGIHSWHIAPGRETWYLPATEDRQTISLVRVKEADGSVQNFAPADFEGDPAAVPDSQLRLMDCIDCHNRPTHVYKLPNQALDEALAAGRIDNTLPYVKMIGVQTLEAVAEVPTQEEGAAQISKAVLDYYQENYQDLLTSRKDTIDSAIAEMQAIYQRNVFPQMDVTWGSYPNNISHIDSPGCFRCHDDSHATQDGETIAQDCTICHTVLALQEENPEILSTLGIE